MNRFNYGAQATQAVSLVGGLMTAGSQLKDSAKFSKQAALNTKDPALLTPREKYQKEFLENQEWEKALAETQKRTDKERAKDERIRNRELKRRDKQNKPQDSINEYKDNSSAPELEALGGALDLVNRQAAEAEPATITDNTEVE